MSEKNMLGDYLRTRRELIQPESVGLLVTGVRRVAGLWQRRKAGDPGFPGGPGRAGGR